MKRILCLFLAAVLLFSWTPMDAGATGNPAVTASAITVRQGRIVTVYIEATGFSTVGSVDFTVYYDSTVLSVYSTYTGSMIDGSDSMISINTDTPGAVKVSAMDIDGFASSGTLLRLILQVPADCPVGKYPLAVVVGDAYGVDLTAVAVSGVDGSVTVTTSQSSQTVVPFQVSMNLYGQPARQGDTVRIFCYNDYSYSFASGDFMLEYDSALFQLETLELADALCTEKAAYSINTDIAGVARISYASSDAVNSQLLIRVTLKVIADTQVRSSVTFSASNIYAEDLSRYAPYETTRSVDLEKKPVEVDAPDLWLDSEAPVLGQQSGSVLYLQKGAGVAAGDFVITYDPEILRCVSVTPTAEVAQTGGMLVVGENFADGTIEFPYVNSNGYSDTDIALVNIVWEALRAPKVHYQTTLSGTMVYDAEFAPVTLEYVTDTGCIYASAVTAPTCMEDGYTTYTCLCGSSYTAEPVSRLGHEEITHAAKTQTCTGIGWEAYVTCSRCDYTTYEDLPALGHDWTEKLEDAAHLKDAAENCTQRNTYWYDCSRCALVSETLFYTGASAGPHSFTERILDDIHRVPGTGSAVRYYYDCAYCEAMGTQSFLKGDLNNDDAVDEDDALYLLKHILLPEHFVANQPVDFDGSGNTDEDDVIYLLQYVLMPTVFPL